MVKLYRKYEDKELTLEAKQVGTLYHVCTLDAFVEHIIPNNELRASGKYWNDLLDTDKAISFTRDSLFVVPTNTIEKSPILFQFVVDGDKLSDRYKVTPYNDVESTYGDHLLLEKEEVVIGPIKNFKSYVKEVRWDINNSLKLSSKLLDYLEEVHKYIGSIPCKRTRLPLYSEDGMYGGYKKRIKEDFDIKTLDELINYIRDYEYNTYIKYGIQEKLYNWNCRGFISRFFTIIKDFNNPSLDRRIQEDYIDFFVDFITEWYTDSYAKRIGVKIEPSIDKMREILLDAYNNMDRIHCDWEPTDTGVDLVFRTKDENKHLCTLSIFIDKETYYNKT